MMEDFERQLKNALAPKEPPAWFEAKVLAAAAREPREPRSWWHRLALGGRLRWASALACAMLAVTGIAWQHERTIQEQAAGQAAKARLELALKITSMKLREIRQKVQAVNHGS